MVKTAVDPVVALLRELEWRYPPEDKDWTGPSRCPVCFAEWNLRGHHKSGCELKQVLLEQEFRNG